MLAQKKLLGGLTETNILLRYNKLQLLFGRSIKFNRCDYCEFMLQNKLDLSQIFTKFATISKRKYVRKH